MPPEVTDVDVVVVGAGPGGAATAAWLARTGHDVLLLEKDRFPRDKICGDGLTPRVIAELLHLGLAHGRAVVVRELDPKVVHHVAQLIRRDVPVPVAVEHLEGLLQLRLGARVIDLARNELQKLGEVQRAVRLVVAPQPAVRVLDHVGQLVRQRRHVQPAHDAAQLLRLDHELRALVADDVHRGLLLRLEERERLLDHLLHLQRARRLAVPIAVPTRS